MIQRWSIARKIAFGFALGPIALIIIGAIALSTLIDGFDVVGISANVVQIVFGAAILIAMIANVQLARLRERGRT